MNEIYIDHPKNQDIMHSKSFEQLQPLVFQLDNNFGIFLQKVYQCDYYEDPNYIDLLALFLY